MFAIFQRQSRCMLFIDLFLWSWRSSLSEKSILCKFYDANIWNISICRNVVFFQIFWLVCSGWVNTTLLTNWKCDISQLEIWVKHQLVSLKLGQGQILHQLKYEVFEVYVASKGWYIYILTHFLCLLLKGGFMTFLGGLLTHKVQHWC